MIDMVNSRTSHEVRGLKFTFASGDKNNLSSHLTRGAWIEIAKINAKSRHSIVAPHTRCVD